MPDPDDLVAVARLLADDSAAEPTDARLRRSISTAYYALFHRIVRTAAQRFMGPGKEASAGYRLLYRSFDHSHMRRVCDKLDASTMNDSFKRHLGCDAVSAEMRDFAGAFSALQVLRHRADYDPQEAFLPSDVLFSLDTANVAMAAFNRAPPDEQADVLALLMVRTRND